MWYQCNTVVKISIHALLAESDSEAVPRRPHADISIHALLAESDHSAGPWQAGYKDFYPRSPCGERRFDSGTFVPAEKFLSTLSLRRATHVNAPDFHSFRISIHALLAESDSKSAQNSGALLRI